MPLVEISEHVEASAQKVWDLISDIKRGPNGSRS